MKGQKTGGRKAGTPNKITSDINFTLARLGCDPIAGMAKIALSKSKKVDDGLRLRAFGMLAEYVYPRRRAIEVTPGKVGPDGAQLVPWPVLMADFHQVRLAKMAKKAAAPDGKKPALPPAAAKGLPGVPRKV